MIQLILAVALMYAVVVSAGMWSKRRQADLDADNARTQ